MNRSRVLAGRRMGPLFAWIWVLAAVACTAQVQGPGPADAYHRTPEGVAEAVSEPEFEVDAEIDAERAAALHRQGLLAHATGELERAVELLRGATARAPGDLLIGTDYRQAVIAHTETLDARRGAVKQAFQHSIEFFERLVATHPEAANAHLNHAFALVDAIPAEGAITRVLLANDSLHSFARALELEESWLGYYSRGHAYLFWPPIFGRVEMGIADLERAVAIARQAEDPQPFHARAWAALGDGYWRLDDLTRARQIWQQGLAAHADDAALLERWQREDRAELDAFLERHYDPVARVATHLHEMYGDRLTTVAVAGGEEERE